MAYLGVFHKANVIILCLSAQHGLWKLGSILLHTVSYFFYTYSSSHIQVTISYYLSRGTKKSISSVIIILCAYVKDYNVNRCAWARAWVERCTKTIVSVQSRRHKHIMVMSCVFHSPLKYIDRYIGILVPATYQLIEWYVYTHVIVYHVCIYIYIMHLVCT